jgi:anti-anti-sigma factor
MSFPLTDVQNVSQCKFNLEWSGSTAVVSCHGVIDMLTASEFERQIETALLQSPSAVVADLTAVTFLASHGMGVLVATEQRITPRVGFAVVADGPITLRPMALIGLDSVLSLHPTLDVALETVRR